MEELRARLQPAGARRDQPDLSPLAAKFLRGLSLGALVGAAIAGSAIWRRLREARGEAGHGASSPSDAPPPSSPA